MRGKGDEWRVIEGKRQRFVCGRPMDREKEAEGEGRKGGGSKAARWQQVSTGTRYNDEGTADCW